MKHLVKICLLIGVLIASINHVAQAAVTSLTATIDKNPVLIDESVTLQLSAVGGADADAIDFSLLTADFRVSQPSVSKSTQIINFDRTTTTTWTLQLFPRRTGPVTVPSFTIDGQSSEAFELSVLPVSQASQAQPRDFYVTTQISNEQVYLQQQIQYTVKIYLSGEIQRGSLSEPVLDGAVIEQLGDDSEYQELVNGVRYRVLERSFAILPQASGNVVIDGPVFQAEVLASTRQSFAFFNRTKTINRVAPSQEITVLPIPQDYQYTWLPSEQVQLNDEWQGAQGEFIQGEPITRIVTLTALGLIEEQLPKIEPQYHPSFKTYPEQAQKATVKQNNRLIAQSVQSTAIIPSEAGTFVLPEIRVPWFDVRSGETKFATLPSQSVTVLAATPTKDSQFSQSSAQNLAVDDNSETNGLQKDTLSNPSANTLFPHVVYGLDVFHLILMVLVLILMLTVLALILRTKPKNTETEQAIHSESNSENQAWCQLVSSIDNNDVQNIQSSLRRWLEFVSKSKVQSVNNALVTLGAHKVAKAFNVALASEYAEQSSEDLGSKGQKQQQELKSALNDLREQLQNQYEINDKTNMYPIS